LGHKAKWEYFRAVNERYHQAGREAKHLMLNEFCLNTGYHRKYAIRLLNGAPPGKQPERRRGGRRARYGPQVLSVLAAIWEAAGSPWSVRLKALLPSGLPWIRKRYRMTPAMEKQLLGISARQIDRRLRAKKGERKRRIYGRTQPGSLLKHPIPVKTDSWDVTGPGFSEIDLVAHGGNSGQGEFAHTLNLTNIHSGWTESRSRWGRAKWRYSKDWMRSKEDCPSVCWGWIRGTDRSSSTGIGRVGVSRSRFSRRADGPTSKDDNAHVEQKNWTHVRKLLGWERYDSEAAVEVINDLYRQELRWWMNLYLPSVKLVKKVRVGSKVRRVYDAAQTPFERVLASAQAKPEQAAELKKLRQVWTHFNWGS
jgi:hypothetical protein